MSAKFAYYGIFFHKYFIFSLNRRGNAVPCMGYIMLILSVNGNVKI